MDTSDPEPVDDLDEYNPNSVLAPQPPPSFYDCDLFSNDEDEDEEEEEEDDDEDDDDIEEDTEIEEEEFPYHVRSSPYWSRYYRYRQPWRRFNYPINMPPWPPRSSIHDDDDDCLVIEPKSESEDEIPSSVGAGLSNLGNTCFLNSVLQCLTHTVELVQRLSLYAHHLPSECNDDMFCMLCALREHVDRSLTSSGRVVSPYKFVNNLSYISSSFQRFHQEDAHEFLQCFLDRLDSSCNNLLRKDTASSSQDDNLVKHVFGGSVVSKLRCCSCNHSSDTFEPSVDLSLEIENADTLSSALESFTKVEKIEDADTKFRCESCKEEVLVEKQLMLEQAPVVSALHLKRFKNYGSYVEKIVKHVEFPLELDLEPYTRDSGNGVDLKYELFAVVVHEALNSTSGHYYCFIRSAPDTWYKFNDSKVTRVREDCVLAQQAYILFYAKQGTPWLSSFMETYKPLLDPSVSNASPKSVLDNVDNSVLSLNLATDNCSNANESNEVAEEIPAESFRHENTVFLEEAKADFDTRDAALRYKTTVFIEEDKADFDRMETSLPPDITKPEAEEVLLSSAQSALNECNFNCEQNKVCNNIVTPNTPLRSHSPEIYKEASQEVILSSDGLEVKSVDTVPPKRQLDDPKIKVAFRLCKKMNGSRGAALFQAATKGSQSEGCLTKKTNRRIAATPNRDFSQSSDSQKRKFDSLSRPLFTASLR